MQRKFLLFSRSFLRWTRNGKGYRRKQPSLDRFIWLKHVRQRSLVSNFIFLAAASLSPR
jgi:hypothetical protein